MSTTNALSTGSAKNFVIITLAVAGLGTTTYFFYFLMYPQKKLIFKNGNVEITPSPDNLIDPGLYNVLHSSGFCPQPAPKIHGHHCPET